MGNNYISALGFVAEDHYSIVLVPMNRVSQTITSVSHALHITTLIIPHLVASVQRRRCAGISVRREFINASGIRKCHADLPTRTPRLLNPYNMLPQSLFPHMRLPRASHGFSNDGCPHHFLVTPSHDKHAHFKTTIDPGLLSLGVVSLQHTFNDLPRQNSIADMLLLW